MTENKLQSAQFKNNILRSTCIKYVGIGSQNFRLTIPVVDQMKILHEGYIK